MSLVPLATDNKTETFFQMLSKIFLSDDYIRNGKCSKCKNYLSVPPIIIHSNNPVCGRCVSQSDNPEENRAYFYEDLAKFMFFPCANDIYGCSVQAPWGEVLEHEICCEFARTLCPAIDCESKLRKEELLKHFEVNHEHLIIKRNQYCFSQSDVEHPSCMNTLLIWGDYQFVVQMRTADANTYFRVSNLKEHAEEGSSLKLIFGSKSSSNSICLKGFKLMKYDSKHPIFSDMERINVNTFGNFLGSEIICTVNFDDEMKFQGYDKLLSKIKHPVRNDFMKSPIFMCPKGHSLCETCKRKLLQCPSCLSDFSDMNYFLGRITETVTYPCRYKEQGCDFAGNLEDITTHEQLCIKPPQTEIRCVVNYKTCEWKGQYEDAFQHIASSHSEHCFYPGYPVSIDLNSSMMEGFFQYDKKIFKLYSNWNKSRIRLSVYWIVNNEKKSVKYQFCVDFVNDKNIFMINRVCSRIPAATILNQNYVHYINIPLQLLKPFIKGKTLNFKLNIVKLR